MLLDITSTPQNDITYGGVSCLKIGVTIDNKNYLVKFPGNIKDEPVCEHLGSQIFKLFGMPVHETMLVKRGEKLVAMCEDFLDDAESLAEFREFKATFEPAFINGNGEVSDGTGTDIDEALLVIREHPHLKRFSNLEQFFWRMFIIDALIGNPDRNNGNWGIIRHNRKLDRIAPVYDNGNCLNNKWDDNKIKKCMEDPQKLQNEIYKAKVCFYTQNGHRVNPFTLIDSGKYEECTKALEWFKQHYNFNEIESLINSCEQLTETQKTFYKLLIEERFKILTSTHKLNVFLV